MIEKNCSTTGKVIGKMDVNVRTGEMKVTNPCDYVTVTVDEPSALSSEQTLWLVTLGNTCIFKQDMEFLNFSCYVLVLQGHTLIVG